MVRMGIRLSSVIGLTRAKPHPITEITFTTGPVRQAEVRRKLPAKRTILIAVPAGLLVPTILHHLAAQEFSRR